MAFKTDLSAEVSRIFSSRWTERDGYKVPEADDLQLSNDGVKLAGTVLYADLADSTQLVDEHTPTFAAEVYKAFLHCAAKIIRAEGGVITAYDGDRIMAVYVGDSKNSSAALTALKINYAMQEIVVPAMRSVYTQTTYVPKHVVGIDTSDLLIARTGVRGANDLVWVGRSANYAAKLAALPEQYATYVTTDVFDRLRDDVKRSNSGKGESMWTTLTWNSFGARQIYGSTWRWRVD